MNKWVESFSFYSKYLDSEGYPDCQLSLDLLSHIELIPNSLSLSPSKVLRKIIEPLIETADDQTPEFITQIINQAIKTLDKFEILLSILPLISKTHHNRTRAVLNSFLRKIGTVLKIDLKKERQLVETLSKISQKCKGTIISNSKLWARDEIGEVTYLSTIESPGETSVMDSETAKDVMSAFQRVESIFVTDNERVAQDEEANIVLMITQ